MVRENRSYDQLLGDVGRGNGDPQLIVFGKNVTPNLHALVTRFPLLDNVFANSEASIQGHFWTAAASVPDYVDRNWVQEYAGRGRPNDFGVYAVTFPGNGFLFNQAERQDISYFNYGEAIAGDEPTRAGPQPLGRAARGGEARGRQLRPRPRPHARRQLPLRPDHRHASATAPDGGEIFDSSLPAGAPAGSYSHIDCFRARFAEQLATGTVPTLQLPHADQRPHARHPARLPHPDRHGGRQRPGDRSAGGHDLALDDLVLLGRSSSSRTTPRTAPTTSTPTASRWRSSARTRGEGAVIHTRYDLLSVVRSMELIMGMKPLSLNDALATPMYDAFTSEPLNSAPVDAIPARVDLLSATAPRRGRRSRRLPLGRLDAVPQRELDAILWKSVYGANSTPPPPGPNADSGE